jgi:hypothetical protein
VQRWFTLFFIPIFPFSSKHFTVCSMCSGATKVDRERAERLSTQGAPRGASTPTPLGAVGGDAVLAPPDLAAKDAPSRPGYGPDPSDFA